MLPEEGESPEDVAQDTSCHVSIRKLITTRGETSVLYGVLDRPEFRSLYHEREVRLVVANSIFAAVFLLFFMA